MQAVLKVGIKANQPGKRFCSFISQTVIIIANIPMNERLFDMYLLFVFIFLYAKRPPIDISQNLQVG